MATATKTRVAGDVLVWSANPLYCGNTSKVKVTLGCTDYDFVGALVKASGIVAVAGEEASIVGVCLPAGLKPLTLAANTYSDELFYVLNNISVVKKSGLPTLDPTGVAYDMAAVIAALAVINVKVVTETGLSNTIG